MFKKSMEGMYKNYYSMVPGMEGIFKVVPEYIADNGWKHIFYVSDGMDEVNELDQAFFDACKARNVTVEASMKLPIPPDLYSGPTLESMETAVLQLKEREARVIVINTGSVAQISCILHRHGLYGPNYVLIQNGGIAFTSDTPRRLFVPGCTEEALFEVLQSITFFGNAAWANIKPKSTDTIGVSALEFDAEMKNSIENPEKSFIW